jgi:MSHA biogenesis protein MshE
MIWRIGEILVQKKLISWEQLEEALSEQKKTKEFTGEILIRKGFIPPIFLYKALSEQYQIRFVDLKRTFINKKAVEMIPRSICEKNGLFPIELGHESLIIGISNPLNSWPEMEIKQLTHMSKIETVLCLPTHIQIAIEEHYPKSDALAAS